MRPRLVKLPLGVGDAAAAASGAEELGLQEVDRKGLCDAAGKVLKLAASEPTLDGTTLLVWLKGPLGVSTAEAVVMGSGARLVLLLMHIVAEGEKVEGATATAAVAAGLCVTAADCCRAAVPGPLTLEVDVLLKREESVRLLVGLGVGVKVGEADSVPATPPPLKLAEVVEEGLGVGEAEALAVGVMLTLSAEDTPGAAADEESVPEGVQLAVGEKDRVGVPVELPEAVGVGVEVGEGEGVWLGLPLPLAPRVAEEDGVACGEGVPLPVPERLPDCVLLPVLVGELEAVAEAVAEGVAEGVGVGLGLALMEGLPEAVGEGVGLSLLAVPGAQASVTALTLA